MDLDISNMTLNEYLMYQGRHKDWERSCTSRKIVASARNRILVYLDFDEEDEDQSKHTPKPPLDEENSSLAEILDDLFRIGAKNIKKIKHEVLNRCDDIIDYEDSDHEDGKLFDLLTFPATNKFTSVCEQVKENIDVNTT
nr:hypothetical protein [Tanacetum cinerariifolium]